MCIQTPSKDERKARPAVAKTPQPTPATHSRTGSPPTSSCALLALGLPCLAAASCCSASWRFRLVTWSECCEGMGHCGALHRGGGRSSACPAPVERCTVEEGFPQHAQPLRGRALNRMLQAHSAASTCTRACVSATIMAGQPSSGPCAWHVHAPALPAPLPAPSSPPASPRCPSAPLWTP